MKLGIIGRGRWGSVYAQTLQELGVDHWQKGRDFTLDVDAAIVASEPYSHYEVAKTFIEHGIPVLVEKPVCIASPYVEELINLAELHRVTVFTGHTRLYSPAWREFKKKAKDRGVRTVYGKVGGPCALEPLWDWGPHLVAMGLDLGLPPEIDVSREPTPLEIVVNGTLTFDDPHTTPRPLEVLLTEFMEVVKSGKLHLDNLRFGLRVVEHLEVIQNGCK